MGSTVGWVVNIIALLWIVFEMILFSMPTVLPVTEVSMNYAIVVFFGFMAISATWYAVHARKGKSSDFNHRYLLIYLVLTIRSLVYKGPPESDGLVVTS